MQTHGFRFDDPAELTGEDRPFEGSLQQVQPGRLDGRALGALADELAVWVYAVDRDVHCGSALRSDQLVLTVPLEMAREGRHNGRTVRAGEVLEFAPQVENTERWGAGVYLDLQASGRLARERGWGAGGESLRSLEPADLLRLRGLAARILAADRESAAHPPDAALRILRAAVVDLLDAHALRPIEREAPHPHHPLAKRALALVEASYRDPALSVSELAARCGTSERTLYRAFTAEVAASPYRYLLLRRLNAMRRSLVQSSQRPGAVTAAAAAAGFAHLGDMGRMYRRFFGETPRETLRRAAGPD